MKTTKPVWWVGRSRDEFLKFPREAQEDIFFALRMAQRGARHPSAKPLKGFKGAGVLEIVESRDGNAYRAVYTTRFREAVCVLHAFQKKSKRGIQTPRGEMRIVEANFKGLAEYMKDRGGAG